MHHIGFLPENHLYRAFLDNLLGCGSVVSQDPPTGNDRQHESREARSLYPSALQLARALRLRFIGRAT
jgi:hypothetical protein